MSSESTESSGHSPAPSELQISKDDLNQLPQLRYDGPIELIQNNRELEKNLSEILSEPVLGFDTETKPSFRKGQSFLPSLVQVATRHCVFLIQLQERELPEALGRILEWPGSLKTGIALNQDVAKLRELGEFTDHGVLDLSKVASRLGIKTTGLRSLTGILLRGRISKGAQVTDWSRPRLSEAQISYAATDAWISRELYFALKQLPGAESVLAEF
ncbi:MAG: 3'-5' exonuclease domain-containing protein 2 [Blastochloris sp.]|nr:3'-5' exonuclease domain-containing protein 2 [Blastochloris sp.]